MRARRSTLDSSPARLVERTMSDQTTEARVLERYPEIREAVMASAEFQQWRDSLPTIEIDGETLYLAKGDVPEDEAQVIYSWARRHGMLAGTEIRAALDGESGREHCPDG
jgi:hypothetical protein